jgi:hypothetical protein
MNDLDELRELRAFRGEVPAADRARLAPGRARLLREASKRRRALRVPAWRVPAWRLAAAGTAVAMLGVPGVIAVVGDGPPGDGGRPPTAAQPLGATAFTERAAQIIERRSDYRPGNHQWVYRKVFHGQAGRRAPEYEVHQETWTRFDGLESAYYTGPEGAPKLKIEDEGYVNTGGDSEERTPLQWNVYLPTLPKIPEQLLATMRAQAHKYAAETGAGERGFPEGRDQWVFRRLAGFLAHEVPMPEPARASIFRGIGQIPGVAVREDARDALGRPGVALVRTGEDGIRTEVVIASGSYTYLGRRDVTTTNQYIPYPPEKTKSSAGPHLKPRLVPAGSV